MTLLLGGLARALPAQTPQRNHLSDRFQLTLSGTNVWLGSTIRVDRGNGSPGTEVDRGDLGASEATLEPRVGLRWRPGRRHELEASYLFSRHSGERVLSDTIVFGDTSFAAGVDVRSAFKSDQASLTYRFAFRARERSQIGAAVGLGALFVNIKIDALAGAGSYSASKGVTAPTASLGLYGRWRTGSRWFIESDARILYFKISRITARVGEAGAAVRYFVRPRAGLELGYGVTSINVNLEQGTSGAGANLSGHLRYTLQNLRLGIIATP